MNQLKTVCLLGALSAVLVAIGGALAPGSLHLFVGLALLMNFGAYFFSDRMVLAMHRAEELTPEQAPGLHRIVDELARGAGIPKPRVYRIPSAQPNAFATGRNPAHGVVAVTSGILEMLTERELRGVIAHEIFHIKNRDILIATIAAGIATAVTYVAHAAQFAAMFGGGQSDDEEHSSPVGTLFLAILAPIAATLIQLGISRSREYLADETAGRLTGDPMALAYALAKLQHGAERFPVGAEQSATASLFIVSPLAGGQSLARLFSTHPPIEDRIRKLEAMARRLQPVSA